MKKVLIITYYWPPSSGSGVQRWMYFCKYLSNFGIEPIVITVDEKKASYKFIDFSFNEKVKHVNVYKTPTFELLKVYSKIFSGDNASGIPQGFAGETVPNFSQKVSRAIRGNFFIPDARVGWVKYAYKKSIELLKKNPINLVITTGPPHSSHLVGLKLKEKMNLKWVADFRDPWVELYYNKLLYRTIWAKKRDANYEKKVLNHADFILTIGPSMKNHLIKRGQIEPTKIDYIYNGYDSVMFDKIEVDKDPNYFTISHIGVLSNNQPITTFIEALKSVFDKNHPICSKLRIRLIGSISPNIVQELTQKIPKIIIEQYYHVPQQKAVEFMHSSDLLFNSLAEMDNSQLLISGKLMEYIATSNPILCLGNPEGDAANLLANIPNSEVFDRKDIKGITVFLEKLFSLWQNNYKFESGNNNYKKFCRLETTKELSELIKKLI